MNTDVNKDGFVDLVVVSDFGGNSTDFQLLVNDGHGHFTNQAVQRGLPLKSDFIGGAVSGDVDGDGDFDIILQDEVRNKLILAKNDGTGHFTTTEFGECLTRGQYGAFQQSLNLGDIDDDAISTSSAPNRTASSITSMSTTATKLHAQAVLPYSGDTAKLRTWTPRRPRRIAFRVSGQHAPPGVHQRRSRHSRTMPPIRFHIPNTNNFGTTDVTDLDRDGTYDVWVGLAGQRPHDDQHLPGSERIAGDLPRNVRSCRRTHWESRCPGRPLPPIPRAATRSRVPPLRACWRPTAR